MDMERESIYVLAVGQDGAARLATVAPGGDPAAIGDAVDRLRNGEPMPLGVALVAIGTQQRAWLDRTPRD